MQTSISYFVGGTVSRALSRFWTTIFSRFGYGYSVVTVGSNHSCYCRHSCVVLTKHDTNYHPPSDETGYQLGTPSKTIRTLRRYRIKFHVPQLAPILLIVCRFDPVLAVNNCVTYTCTESSGGVVAVFLTDNTPGCSDNAANYLVSKCGAGYSGTTCNVDCNGIYAYSGSYWKAEGCTTLGNPCGAQGECDSSVLNVCQNSQSSTPTSTSSPRSTGSTSDINTLNQCCGKDTCAFGDTVLSFCITNFPV